MRICLRKRNSLLCGVILFLIPGFILPSTLIFADNSTLAPWRSSDDFKEINKKPDSLLEELKNKSSMGEIISTFCKEADISREGLSRMSGVSPAALKYWEEDKGNPLSKSYEKLYPIGVLGKALKYFMEEKEGPMKEAMMKAGSVGEVLEIYRLAKRHTHETLGKMIGVNKHMVKAWVYNEVLIPKPHNLEKIYSVDELRGYVKEFVENKAQVLKLLEKLDKTDSDIRIHDTITGEPYTIVQVWRKVIDPIVQEGQPTYYKLDQVGEKWFLYPKIKASAFNAKDRALYKELLAEESVGDMIRKYRLSRGYTLSYIGHLIGVTESAVSHYESNNRFPDDEVWGKLIDIDVLGPAMQLFVDKQEERDFVSDERLLATLKKCMSIHEMIKTYRTTKNLTQKKSADLIGIPFTTYLAWENETHYPHVERLELLYKIDVLGDAVKWFVDKEKKSAMRRLENAPSFMEILIAYRNVMNYSQAELAKKISVGKLAVSRWELGETVPHERNLQKLCKIKLLGDVLKKFVKPRQPVLDYLNKLGAPRRKVTIYNASDNQPLTVSEAKKLVLNPQLDEDGKPVNYTILKEKGGLKMYPLVVEQVIKRVKAPPRRPRAIRFDPSASIAAATSM